ncbi:unnamed protein product [Staurois parvus]|uniref:Uncharacterized protein n=1 Tax=Staurois parvus TaxID=386267 RepID=A0ABN9GMZ7_9NEOB|nr:unnamed protein product [Staurois parvus]
MVRQSSGSCHVSQPLLYSPKVCSVLSSPLLCMQWLVISCSMSAVSGHLLYYVRSLWSSPVVCLQSLAISCTMSAVHWFRTLFLLFSSSKT